MKTYGVKQLSLEEEQVLASKIRKGIEAQNSGLNNAKCQRLIDEGNQARELLILSNIKFVRHMVKEYIGKGVSSEDLFQAGSLGLTIAANKYSPDANTKFCSYAVFWIREEMIKAIEKNRRIHVPKNIVGDVKKYKFVKEELEAKFNRCPSVAEIAKEMGIENNQVLVLMDASSTVTSLDNEVGEDTTLSDFVADESENLEGKFKQKELINTLYDAMDSILNDRERTVVFKYFGMKNNDDCSFQRIGDELGISRESARKIYNGAILKIQNSNYFNDLRILYEG